MQKFICCNRLDSSDKRRAFRWIMVKEEVLMENSLNTKGGASAKMSRVLGIGDCSVCWGVPVFRRIDVLRGYQYSTAAAQFALTYRNFFTVIYYLCGVGVVHQQSQWVVHNQMMHQWGVWIQIVEFQDTVVCLF